jgi:hypothetical protein
MSTFEDRQSALQSRIESIDQEIARVDESFAELASQFSGIDGQESLRQASQLETRLAALRREKSLAMAAQSHVTQEQLREKQQQADKDRRALQAERQQHVDAVTTLSRECDEFLGRLRELLERRQSHLHSLGALGANGAILAKLAKPALTRAACYAGLAKYFALERGAPTSLLPLASTSTLVAGLGREEVNAPLPTLPLSEEGTVDCPPATAPSSPTNGGKEFGHDVQTENAPTDGFPAHAEKPTNGEPEPERRRRWGRQ